MPPTESLPSSTLELHDEELIEKLREHRGPLVLTRDGEPTAVGMSPEEFERLTEAARFIASVTAGLADSEMGRLVSDEDLGQELDAVLGSPTP